MPQTAFIVGTSGIVGGAAAERVLGDGWRVYGLARRPSGPAGVTPGAADLQDADGLRAALEGAAPGGVAPHGVVISTGSRQASEAETLRSDGARGRS